VRASQTVVRSAANQSACLVQIYPPGAGLGRLHSLDGPVLLGRETDSTICIDESAASRHHARIVARDDGYYVADLRSTNGTFVNNVRVLVRKLEDGDYVRVGTHIFRFLAGGNIEADYHEEIYRLTITDALTGIHNKRHLLEFLERELTRSTRHERPLAVVLFDIDHFKAINDHHGHLAGDLVLRELTQRLRKEVRRDELFARYGGEEFVVVLPETTLEGAVHVAERLRALAADESFDYNGQALTVTISLGVAGSTGCENLTPLEFIGRADAKLYQAKQEGRNRVVG
jgi:diguanylate cyclase (GGDEF)-like protein